MRERGRIESKVPVLVRFEASRANELWQVDHCRLHIWLVNERGRASKPWLTMVLDDYSRCITGYRLSWGGFSAEQTALALRGAIWSKGDERWPICGIPENLYSDHGSDFTSKHVQALAADLKIELLHSRDAETTRARKNRAFFSDGRTRVISGPARICSQSGLEVAGGE